MDRHQRLIALRIERQNSPENKRNHEWSDSQTEQIGDQLGIS
jgi:hypothetical protein